MILAALIVAAAVIGAALAIVRELRTRSSTGGGGAIQLIQAFAPGIAAAQADPRALLVWQPLAATARRMFPAEFAALDRAAGAEFPFSKAAIEAAHARWTAEWLAWERSHDGEFKLKAAAVEHDLAASGGSPLVRARLDAVEREKLESYQRRYEDYVRVSKALQALLSHPESRLLQEPQPATVHHPGGTR
jgi:hypothetical protein